MSTNIPIGVAALEHIVRQAGSVSKLAGDLNVPITTVRAWLVRESVPAAQCPALEAYSVMLAGGRDSKPSSYVVCEQLNNDTPWFILRNNSLPRGRDTQIDKAWRAQA